MHDNIEPYYFHQNQPQFSLKIPIPVECVNSIVDIRRRRFPKLDENGSECLENRFNESIWQMTGGM